MPGPALGEEEELGGVSGCFFGVSQAPGEPRVMEFQVEVLGRSQGLRGSSVPVVPLVLGNVLVGKEQLQQQEWLGRGWEGIFPPGIPAGQ